MRTGRDGWLGKYGKQSAVNGTGRKCKRLHDTDLARATSTRTLEPIILGEEDHIA